MRAKEQTMHMQQEEFNALQCVEYTDRIELPHRTETMSKFTYNARVLFVLRVETNYMVIINSFQS